MAKSSIMMTYALSLELNSMGFKKSDSTSVYETSLNNGISKKQKKKYKIKVEKNVFVFTETTTKNIKMLNARREANHTMTANIDPRLCGEVTECLLTVLLVRMTLN